MSLFTSGASQSYVLKAGRFPHHYATLANGWERTPRDRLLYHSEPALYCRDKEDLSSFVEEQNMILDHIEEHLQQVISAFPKLSTITLCNSYWTKSAKFKYALRENSISRQWIRKSQLLSLFKVIANTPSCNISKINVQGYSKPKPYRYLNNCDFGEDAHIPGSVKYCLGSNFKTAHYTKESIPIIYDTLSLHPKEIITTQGIFSNLMQLNLGISTIVRLDHSYREFEDEPKSYWADFPKILKSLTKVVDLSLDMNVRRAVDQQHTYLYYHDDLKELLGDLQMPQLERLKLSQFRSCASSVISLLLGHPKIKDLSLRFIIEIETGFHSWDGSTWHLDPQWVQCVEVMRDLKLRRLQLQGVEGFGHDSNRHGSENEDLTLSRIYDYILYGYGDNPLLTRRPVEVNGLAWDAELW